MTKKAIYLDYAAATPMEPLVLEAMEQYFVNNFYNPSASYLAAKAVKKDINHARAEVAQQLGTRPAEIIFTAGATEANNQAISGVMRNFPEGEVLVGAIEHDSVRGPANLFNCREIPVTSQGLVEPSAVKKLISDRTVLVSVGLINNEIGTLQPMKEIASLILLVRDDRREKGNKLPIYLHSDAAQAGCYLPLNVSKLGVDMMSINGGKIYGPKQSGALFIKSGVKLLPLIVGGGQEWGVRAGTENVANIIGLSKALVLAQTRRTQESKRVAELRSIFIDALLARFPYLQINGSPKHHGPHIASVTLPGLDNERLMMELDELGVQCAVGSACSASNREPSHVLTAIGLNSDLARFTLRFSFGLHTTNDEVLSAARKLCQVASPNR
ncbi:cysteine desulfurase [Candidatus Saccharibacteria bacterium]|nr:cysteine desulfurase [Candidatus Saccharibacteria bacterium]